MLHHSFVLLCKKFQSMSSTDTQNLFTKLFFFLVFLKCTIVSDIYMNMSTFYSSNQSINQSIKTNIFLCLIKNKYSNSLLQCYHESLSKCHINLQVADYFYITLSSSIITIFNTYLQLHSYTSFV